MEYILWFKNFVLHLDKHLADIVLQYGTWTYLILFLIIFCETGLVVTPFLPGDSLLFAAGTLAALKSLNVFFLLALLCTAAIVGDALNYAIGYFLGPKLLASGHSRLIKKEHLERTHKFYEKYGKKAIILARFVPIVRTFIPFLAGFGSMSYGVFAAYNIIGGMLWVSFFVLSGFFFGNIEIVRKNFSLVILAIMILSIMPMIYEYIMFLKDKKAEAAAQAGANGAAQKENVGNLK